MILPSNKIHLSVIVPCYNPPDTWLVTLDNYLKQIMAVIPNTEVILINDGSTKGFFFHLFEIYERDNPGTKLVWNKANKGKGYALREGVKAATGELIIYTDIDFPYTPESFLKIYAELQTGNTDIAIGIRGQEYYTHLPKTRALLSKLLRSLIKIFLRVPTNDTQCGLKGMNQKGKVVFLQTTIDRYLFDLEFIFVATQKKLSIKTVEVELRPDIVLSKMNWKILLQEFGNFLKIFVRSFF